MAAAYIPKFLSFAPSISCMWKTIRNLMAGGLLAKVLTGVANIMVINFLTKEDYASLANFQFIQTLMSGLIFSPFLLSSVIGINLFEMKNMRRLFAALNLIQIALVAICCSLVLLFGDQAAILIFNKPVFYYPMILGLISSLFLTFQNIILSGHQASESYGSYNIVNVLRPTFLISLLVGFYLSGKLSFVTAASSFLLSYVFAVAGDLKAISDSLKLKGLIFRLKQFVWFWKSLKHLILFFFIRAILDHIGRFMVSRYFSVEDNADFGVAFQYYSMVDLVIYSSHVAFTNIFTKENSDVARGKYVSWLKITAVLSLAGLAILPFSKPVFLLINGNQYQNAFAVFCVFMAGTAVYLCFSPLIYCIAARKNFRFLLILSLVALIWQLGFSTFASSLQSLELVALGCVGARALIYLGSFILFVNRR